MASLLRVRSQPPSHEGEDDEEAGWIQRQLSSSAAMASLLRVRHQRPPQEGEDDEEAGWIRWQLSSSVAKASLHRVRRQRPPQEGEDDEEAGWIRLQYHSCQSTSIRVAGVPLSSSGVQRQRSLLSLPSTEPPTGSPRRLLGFISGAGKLISPVFRSDISSSLFSSSSSSAFGNSSDDDLCRSGSNSNSIFLVHVHESLHNCPRLPVMRVIVFQLHDAHNSHFPSYFYMNPAMDGVWAMTELVKQEASFCCSDLILIAP